MSWALPIFGGALLALYWIWKPQRELTGRGASQARACPTRRPSSSAVDVPPIGPRPVSPTLTEAQVKQRLYPSQIRTVAFRTDMKPFTYKSEIVAYRKESDE